jgi:hypothetical protein
LLLQGGKLECEPSLQLLPPSAGSRAVAATCTAERTAVLWSDGSVAVYLLPGDKQPLLRGLGQTGESRQPVAQRRLGGYRLPAGKQKGGSGASASKKRGAAGDADAAAGGVSMAAIGEKQVAVVGWASDSEGEGPTGTWLLPPLPAAAGAAAAAAAAGFAMPKCMLLLTCMLWHCMHHTKE